MIQHENDPRALHFLQAVEEACRRSGGKHLLTREEYLEIVNRCYCEIFNKEQQPATASA